ncbi:MAG: cupredoxin domain-containing protein [Chloroflexota bacterium]
MKRTASIPTVMVALTLVLSACTGAGTPDTSAPSVAPSVAPATPPATPAPPPATVAPDTAQYVANAADFVKAANWDTKKTVTIELAEMSFTPKDIVLEAGQPYVLEIVNVGTEKHEFTAEGFMRTVATRKAETPESEVKVPFFTEIEVFAGKTVELFIIPLIPGTYDVVCEIGLGTPDGHFEKGMFGTITVTGQTPASPALQLAAVDSGPWITDGGAQVKAADWDTKQTIQVDLAEMSFTPKDTVLKVGQPYVISVVNVGTEKHEFTAEDFFNSIAFRKAEDASGEFKGPAPLEVEVFAGQSIELFLIPTKAGVYDLVCLIKGHFEKGMFGTITVVAGG